METVTVFIPPEKAPYTLFAEGGFLRMDGDDESGWSVEFDAESALLLYYHFPFHRRLYVTCHADSRFPLQKFSGVSDSRSLLCELYGRAFDRMKRAMPHIVKLTGGRCFFFPPEFWLRISHVMRYGKNSRMNISRIVSEFSISAAT